MSNTKTETTVRTETERQNEISRIADFYGEMGFNRREAWTFAEQRIDYRDSVQAAIADARLATIHEVSDRD